MRSFFTIVLALITAFPAFAESAPEAFRSTNLPLPRFASLSADKVFVRSGPGTQYPVLWVFERKNYPVEIILEFENWRKIKDHEGAEGWVHLSLLSGRRYGMINSDEQITGYEKPDAQTQVMVVLEPKVIGRLSGCKKEFCQMEAQGYRGWVERKFIWGVYAHENLD